MSENDDDEEARRERARRIRERIDEAVGGDTPAAPASPREFTDRAARESDDEDEEA